MIAIGLPVLITVRADRVHLDIAAACPQAEDLDQWPFLQRCHIELLPIYWTGPGVM